ncbi:MAG: helicase-related protein [Nitrososphaerota archaeon]|nr:helicase-related protein [Candidatus Bathyarchaeota archaeon]MCX8161768.1 helicase-related protein [Candidatus Bathyarchaeota archaeon]MDW8061759.1 helicase-related protein [Nitrososphaerota archaeon]
MKYVRVEHLSYTLWGFQERILERIVGDTLIVGLPTGLGKTYIAGAFLRKVSLEKPIRVLFLVPSIPLGVQQTLFAREKLNVEAFFISGELPRYRRAKLKVWNAGFVVCTPQTFFNDILSDYREQLIAARSVNDPADFLRGHGLNSFPYDIVIADECQRYVGLTDGYSILLAAKASGSRILALSATPLLHDARRYSELKKIFDDIQVFTVEDPEIERSIPKRVLKVVEVELPSKVKLLYDTITRISDSIVQEIRASYGDGHEYMRCDEHEECKKARSLKILAFRLVEDGASSVIRYQTWRLPEVKRKYPDTDISPYRLFLEVLKDTPNHKLGPLLTILSKSRFEKAIIFVEPIQAAKQIGSLLQGIYGVDHVAILVGKEMMDLTKQTAALLHFKGKAKILVATSVAEEGLDVPSADLEIWIDPPSNPRKWIQRFGRILRQPGGKKEAVTYAIISRDTHEESKLRSISNKAARYYGFTQMILEEDLVKQKYLTDLLHRNYLKSEG